MPSHNFEAKKKWYKLKREDVLKKVWVLMINVGGGAGKGQEQRRYVCSAREPNNNKKTVRFTLILVCDSYLMFTLSKSLMSR